MLFLPSNIENLSRKDRERYYKRMEILNAATALFAEKGYQNTTIDLIAEHAEFGKGTIYNYFEGKEDIYWAIVSDIFNAYLESLQNIDSESDNFFDFIKKTTESLFSFCVNNKHAFIMITRLRTSAFIHSEKIREAIQKYQKNADKILLDRIEAAIEKKQIKKVNPNSLIKLYRSMIFPYVYHQMFCEEKTEINVVRESNFIVDVLFNGIKK